MRMIWTIVYLPHVITPDTESSKVTQDILVTMFT